MTPTATGPRFAAVYIRVSTDEQAELSPESQLMEIRRYAQREGIVLLQEHTYIEKSVIVGIKLGKFLELKTFTDLIPIFLPVNRTSP